MIPKLVVLFSAAALTPAGCGSASSGAASPASTTTSTSARPTTTSEPAPTTTTSDQVPPTVADDTNLQACLDGVCEVEVKLGDVIPFGSQVRSTPPLTSLTVIEMNADGPMLSDPSGFASTVNGSVTMNNAITIETLYTDGTRAMLRISLAAQ